MRNEVILLAGLPGCGKTTRLCRMLEVGWLVFDDFKFNAFDHSSAFRKSRKFSSLIGAISDGVRCAIADIDFCKSESRDEAESALRAEITGLSLEWLFFANDWTACEVNIRLRNRSGYQEELQKLRELSPSYKIPSGATVIPVTLCGTAVQ
jgi:hypothetical protein